MYDIFNGEMEWLGEHPDLPEIVGAAMNANCGGRDHAAIHVERQVLEWARATGSPETGDTGGQYLER